MVPIYLGGEWLNRAPGDPPNRGAEGRVIGRKFEVQLRRYLE